jgi:hypothetical protein
MDRAFLDVWLPMKKGLIATSIAIPLRLRSFLIPQLSQFPWHQYTLGPLPAQVQSDGIHNYTSHILITR